MLVYTAVGAIGLLFLLTMLFVGDLFGGDHDFDHGFDHDGDAGRRSELLFRPDHRGVRDRVRGWRCRGAVLRALASGVVRRWSCDRVRHGRTCLPVRAIPYSQQASSELRMAGLLGRHGEITIGIPAGGVGEITVTVGGERTTHIARSADGAAIAAGTEVVVSSVLGPSVVVTRAPQSGGAHGAAARERSGA